MTRDIIIKTFKEKYNIDLKPDDLDYSMDWFRCKIEECKFQIGIEDGIFKINIDLDSIGYDEPINETLNWIKKKNKEIGLNKRVYLGEADNFYKIFPNKGVLENIKSKEDIIELVNEFIEFASNEKISWLK